MFFCKSLVAMKRSITFDEGIHFCIILPSSHDLDGMTKNRMHERTDLPGAQVSCKEQHTATSTTGSRIVFESVVNGDSASIFCRVAWKHAELSQMASEADKQLTNNACPIGLLHFRKRDL